MLTSAHRLACYLVTVLLIALFVLGTACCDHEYFAFAVPIIDGTGDTEDGTKQVMCANPDATPELQGATCEAIASAERMSSARTQIGNTSVLAGKDLDEMNNATVIGIGEDDPAEQQRQTNRERMDLLEKKVNQLLRREKERASA